MGTSNKIGSSPYIKPLLEPAKLLKQHHLYQPGEEIPYQGLIYQALEGKSCKKCVFYKEGCCHKPQPFNECCGYSRSDKTWIYFVIKEE